MYFRVDSDTSSCDKATSEFHYELSRNDLSMIGRVRRGIYTVSSMRQTAMPERRNLLKFVKNSGWFLQKWI